MARCHKIIDRIKTENEKLFKSLLPFQSKIKNNKKLPASEANNNKLISSKLNNRTIGYN